MRHNRTRRGVPSALTGLGAVAVAGCLIGDGGEETENVFRISSPWIPESLDPAVSGSIFKRMGITDP